MPAQETSENRKLGRISLTNSALFICDMQEKFRAAIFKFDEIVCNTEKLVKAAKILKLPIISTEQYPKGLGNTVTELKLEDAGVTPVMKTCFTMALPQITDNLKKKHSKDWILDTGSLTDFCSMRRRYFISRQDYENHTAVCS